MHLHPPGPTNYNAGIGLTWRHGLALWWNPLAYVTQLAHHYGDMTFFRVFHKRLYIVNHPALIREVLVVQQRAFQKLEHSRRVLGSGFGNGLILAEGEPWLKQRRMLSGIFGGERMARYAEITVKHTRRLLQNWEAGRKFNAAETLVDLTLTIIGEILFSVDLSAEASRLGRAALAAARVFAKEEYSPLVLPDWLPLPSKRQKRRVNGMFRQLIGDLLIERHQSGQCHDDLLDLQLHAIAGPVEKGNPSFEQAVDDAMTLFHGGYHSSSMGLTWALHLLSQHPDILAQVAAEADQVYAGREPQLADVAELPYTEMVLKESLRIYPPAWELFARENTTAVELGGYPIEKGGIFLIYPLVTHRDGRFFPEPLQFDPERFLPSRERQIPNMAYFPFGGGPLNCIGKPLAMMEMTLILSMIAREFRLASPAGKENQVEPEALIAIRPKPDIALVPQMRPGYSAQCTKKLF